MRQRIYYVRTLTCDLVTSANSSQEAKKYLKKGLSAAKKMSEAFLTTFDIEERSSHREGDPVNRHDYFFKLTFKVTGDTLVHCHYAILFRLFVALYKAVNAQQKVDFISRD